MSKIKIMDINLSNKIAAGEVVERMVNVVKELVENSLDARATIIKIELIDAGIKEIKIIDNGSGMDEIDAANSFLRHATSKLSKEADLFKIETLGFRGEALSSIASVSKVTMQTSDGNIGTKIIVNGGKLEKKEKSDSYKGTMIIVQDIFYNTPARLKYLKSDATELANCVSFIEKIALSYKEVSFYLSNNGKEILKTSGSNNLLKTIYEIYGLEISKNMLEIKGANADYEISGFICKPSILKGTRNFMTSIVNGRVVRNIELNRVINDAYHTYKPDIKYPIVVLNIKVDPTLIDVNIHPTKQDIKFSKFGALNELVYENIKNALYHSLLIPKVEVKTKEESNNEIPIMFEKEVPYIINEELTNYNEEEQTSFDFKETKNSEIKKLELYPCGSVLGTYIIAQNEEGMYLIDQHAAQERINYEKILGMLKARKIETIDLLIPINLELSPSDYLKLKEHINTFEELGFKISDFGVNSILVNTHPTWIKEGFEKNAITQVIDLILELPNEFDLMKFHDNLASTMACNESVKGNTALSEEQMKNIIDMLILCDNPYNCPHGRPTIITFSKYELERMFKRNMN